MTRIGYYRAPAAHHATADQAGLESIGRTAWLYAQVTAEAIEGMEAPEGTAERMALDYTTSLYANRWAALGDAERLYWDRGWYREKLGHDVRCAYRDACARIAAVGGSSAERGEAHATPDTAGLPRAAETAS